MKTDYSFYNMNYYGSENRKEEIAETLPWSQRRKKHVGCLQNEAIIRSLRREIAERGEEINKLATKARNCLGKMLIFLQRLPSSKMNVQKYW